MMRADFPVLGWKILWEICSLLFVEVVDPFVLALLALKVLWFQTMSTGCREVYSDHMNYLRKYLALVEQRESVGVESVGFLFDELCPRVDGCVCAGCPAG